MMMMVKMSMKVAIFHVWIGNILFTSIIVTVCTVDIIITDTIKITRNKNINKKSKFWEVWEGIIGKNLSILGSAL